MVQAVQRLQRSQEYIALNIGSFDNQNIANSAWAYATTQLLSNSGRTSPKGLGLGHPRWF
jgi:hypothetical protein